MTNESKIDRDQSAAKWLVTVDELAVLIGEKPRTIRRWAKNGNIPVLKFSERCTRFSPEAVRDALLDQRDKQTIGGGGHVI